MGIGSIDRVRRHKISDLFMVMGRACLNGTYTSGGEYVSAKSLGLQSIIDVDSNTSNDGIMTSPLLTNRGDGDSCFRLKMYTAEDTELSGAVNSQVDFRVYGR
jgi:hypothetical protein